MLSFFIPKPAAASCLTAVSAAGVCVDSDGCVNFFHSILLQDRVARWSLFVWRSPQWLRLHASPVLAA